MYLNAVQDTIVTIYWLVLKFSIKNERSDMMNIYQRAHLAMLACMWMWAYILAHNLKTAGTTLRFSTRFGFGLWYGLHKYAIFITAVKRNFAQ